MAAIPSGGAGAGSGGGTTGGSGGSGTPSGSGGGGGGARSVITPASTGNVALDRIVANDDLVRSFIGMSDSSPVPTPPVTAEGVPLQEWDFYGMAYSLMFKAIGATDPDVPSETQLEQIVTAGRWKPTTAADFKPLLLGGEIRGPTRSAASSCRSR